MEGTYVSEELIRSFIPEHVPAPLAFGSYEAIPSMHYYICDYVDMTDDLPDPARFGQTLAKLHLNSMGKTSTGQYGFPLTTPLAFVPNDNTWTDTWTEWFSNAMRKSDPAPPATDGDGGNRIEPCLCHSDVWPGNVKPSADDDEVMMFDSCAFWSHHECFTESADLGTCRAPRYRMGRAYVKEYFKTILPSKPEEDFEDRFALYAMRYDLLHSALFPKEPRFRATAMAEMQRLVDKYPEGFQEAAVF
ncbi:uncharacterized protein PG986_001732 [Apiospora aurea]|uniref:protein-ribulosamine 3-kinase n=1 Tax=Apiospora aurea TaxID=335848 RepID=A0ABR1QZF4_9PEZI